MAVDAASELLERDAQVAAIAALLERARRGEGGVLVVEGPAGIGKSRLLAHARTLAGDRGLLVLAARATGLEQDFAFGVVRQLFEPLLIASEPAERDALLAGAAALAAPVLDPGVLLDGRSEPSYGALHGLYWLLANAAESRAVLVVVDDLHWCDPASLRYLAYLAPRLEGLAAALVLGLRTGDEAVDAELLDAVAGDAAATRLPLAPLGLASCAAVARSLLGEEPSAAFADAVQRATGGNALFTREVLLAAQAAGLGADDAAARSLPAVLGGASLARVVRRRVDRLPEAARALARAAAVAGEDASEALVGALAGMSPREATAARDQLVRAEIVAPGALLEFVHPVVRLGVLAGLAPGERGAAHARCAALLAASGASVERQAIHLVEAPPGGDPEVVATLCAAARRAADELAAETAERLLVRAVAEPPPADDLPGLLLELGTLQSTLRPVAALDTLARAAELLPRGHAGLARATGSALYSMGRTPEASVLLAAAADAAPPGSEERAQLEGDLSTIGRFDATIYPDIARRLAAIEQAPEPTTPAAAGLLAVLASEDARAGVDRERALARARAALASRQLVGDPDSMFPVVAVQVLTHADELQEALAHFDELVASARAAGSSFGYAQLSALRGAASYRLGDLAEAEADIASAVEVSFGRRFGARPYAAGSLAEILLERGDVDGARAALGMLSAADIEAAIWQSGWAREVRAQLRLAEGRVADAAEDALAAGAVFERLGSFNPSQCEWRRTAARALFLLGDAGQAREIAAEGLRRARVWGGGRTIGVALRVCGGVAEDDAEALEVLARVGCCSWRPRRRGWSAPAR